MMAQTKARCVVQMRGVATHYAAHRRLAMQPCSHAAANTASVAQCLTARTAGGCPHAALAFMHTQACQLLFLCSCCCCLAPLSASSTFA
jgi:hypothetical protein